MTESGKQRLRLFAVFLCLLMMFFVLEGGYNPSGFYKGMIGLTISVMSTIDCVVEPKKVYKIPYAAFSIMFLVIAFYFFVQPL